MIGRRRAFTANELVFVLLMIVIMSSIIGSQIPLAREKALTSKCASNVRQLVLAMHMYGADNGGFFPPGTKNAAALYVYTKNIGIFSCPSAKPPPKPAKKADVDSPSAPSPEWLFANGGPPPITQEDYLFNPHAHTDDLPSTIIVGDDAPARHRGGWNGGRVDGATAWYPAADFHKMLGWVMKDEQRTK